MEEAERYEQIERYLSKEMSAQEQQDFETQIAKKTALAQEVALHQELADTFGGEEEQVVDILRGKIVNTIKESKQAKIRRIRQFRYWAVAASIILIGIVGLLLMKQLNPTYTSDQLFADNLELPRQLESPDESVSRGNTSDNNSSTLPLEDQFFNLYNAQDYEAALQELENMARTNPNILTNQLNTYNYYLALTYLQLEQYEQALLALENLSYPYEEEADWYKALVQLKLEGFSSNTYKQIERISTSSSRFNAEAEKILKEFP